MTNFAVITNVVIKRVHCNWCFISVFHASFRLDLRWFAEPSEIIFLTALLMATARSILYIHKIRRIIGRTAKARWINQIARSSAVQYPVNKSSVSNDKSNSACSGQIKRVWDGFASAVRIHGSSDI